jgi:hypothetical protein
MAEVGCWRSCVAAGSRQLIGLIRVYITTLYGTAMTVIISAAAL